MVSDAAGGGHHAHDARRRVDREVGHPLPFDDLDAALAGLRDQVGVELLAGARRRRTGRSATSHVRLLVDDPAFAARHPGDAHGQAQGRERPVRVAGQPAAARLVAREARLVEDEEAGEPLGRARRERDRGRDPGRAGAGDDDVAVDGGHRAVPIRARPTSCR